MNVPGSVPVLSCDETKRLEAGLFAGNEVAEWQAMQAAGTALAAGMLADFNEIGGFPPTGRILLLVGKGHNGGDAMLAAACILAKYPTATAEVLLVYGVQKMRPLAMRAWRQLQHSFADRVRAVRLSAWENESYDLTVDGLFGFQYHPPLDGRSTAALRKVNALRVRLRAAVDLPSGLDAPDAFKADFTYATGVVKTPLLALTNAGRLRYLDLGFFAQDRQDRVGERVLTPSVLLPLRGWRDPQADKRHHGHLFVLAGSRSYPGAALMNVLAALRSGAGLVTAFVPESLAAAFAAQVPEAIWVGWPETPEGGLALEGRHLLLERVGRATAMVVGSGLGREKETMALAADVVKTVKVPVVLDADALQPDVVNAAQTHLVMTPHAGEFARIARGQPLREFAAAHRATVVLKGPVTRVCAGEAIHHSFFGGPVLARGGSGDLLAGIIGTQVAQAPADPLASACRGVAWHGLAADALARSHGAVAVRTTQVLDFLAPTLRD